MQRITEPRQGVMQIGYLTACVQTPPGTTGRMFIDEPRKASLIAAVKHIDWAKKNNIPTLELACALAPRDSSVPAEKMADPVGYHTPIETRKDGTGRDLDKDDLNRIVDACEGLVGIGTFGAFDNLLDENADVRRQNIEHCRRAIRTAAEFKAAGLKTKGVTIFVGRNLSLSLKENMRLFAEVVVALVRYAKSLGVILFIENCPMYGWSGRKDILIHNLANEPYHWIIMARMIKAAGLKGWCYINYDPSHDILQGMRPETSFLIMKMAGCAWFISRFHVKDLSRQKGKTAVCGFLGDQLGESWDTMDGDQPGPGATEINIGAMAEGLQVHWLGMDVAAREHLELDIPDTTLTIEFEQSQFRNPSKFDSQEQHWDVVMGMMAAMVDFMKGTEISAAANFALKGIIQANNTQKHPTTWSWQSPVFAWDSLVGAPELVEKALAWPMSQFPETTDLVLGSDLKIAA